MLGKYYSIYLVAAFIVAALAHPARWAYLRSPSPWISVAVGLIALAPHLRWLTTIAFTPFDYVYVAHGGASPGQVIASIVTYLLGGLGYIALPGIVYVLLVRPDLRTLAQALWPSDPDRRMLVVLLAVPLLLPALSAPFLAVPLTSLWTMQAWFLLPIVMLAPNAVVVARSRAVYVAALVLAVTVLALIAAPVAAWKKHADGARHGQGHYRALSDETTREWRRHTQRPLTIAIGDINIVGALTFYGPDHPDSVPDFNLAVAPWVTPDRLRREGHVVVCESPACVLTAERWTAAEPQAIRREIEVSRRYLGTTGKKRPLHDLYRVAVGPEPRRERADMSGDAPDWRSFWDRPHSIYVNARHFDVHYRDIAQGIIAQLPGPNARVLDYGSGEATHADLIAAAAAELILCEAAPSVRASLTRRFAGNRRIRVLAPEEVEQLPDASIDLLIANSLVQYITPAELDRLLAVWRLLLTPEGLLIVADVIPLGVGPLTDTMALLRYAAKNGFFIAAIIGIGRTMVSGYRRLRARLGIACYGEAEFLGKLAAAGFAAERLPFNLEHNPARMTFRARPSPP